MQFESNIKRENFETIADMNYYHKLVILYDEASNQMNTWESDFVDNLITEVPRLFSDKQKTKIGQIFKRYCG